MVKALADSAGLPVVTGMHAPGGISVGDVAQGTQAHMNNPALFSLIRSRKWDFAVIQDNQGRFVRDSAVFPSTSLVIQGHLNIMDSVKANNSCAKIILFGGWAWKNGMPPFGNTGTESIQRILVNYRVLNDTMKETIAPIGLAWIKAYNYLPAVNLWDTDDAHPSYAGSFLTASVLFSTIFNLPARDLDFVGTLTDKADTALYGRVTYEMMQAYWPTAGQKPNASKHDKEHSAWYAKVPKVVLSTTLNEKNLDNTKIISNRLAENINQLKNQDGRRKMPETSRTCVKANQ